MKILKMSNTLIYCAQQYDGEKQKEPYKSTHMLINIIRL